MYTFTWKNMYILRVLISSYVFCVLSLHCVPVHTFSHYVSCTYLLFSSLLPPPSLPPPLPPSLRPVLPAHPPPPHGVWDGSPHSHCHSHRQSCPVHATTRQRIVQEECVLGILTRDIRQEYNWPCTVLDLHE